MTAAPRGFDIAPRRVYCTSAMLAVDITPRSRKTRRHFITLSAAFSLRALRDQPASKRDLPEDAPYDAQRKIRSRASGVPGSAAASSLKDASAAQHTCVSSTFCAATQ